MANNRQRTEETAHTSNGIDAGFMSSAHNITDKLSPALQGYLALGAGIFLLLFGLGYFSFVKVAIGFIGIALIAWGALKSKLLSTVTGWFEKLAKRF